MRIRRANATAAEEPAAAEEPKAKAEDKEDEKEEVAEGKEKEVVKSDAALMHLSKIYIASHPDVSNRIFLQVWPQNLPSEHLFVLPLINSLLTEG